MAADEDLLGRVRAVLKDRKPREQKMFGGVCFMVNGNMAVGTSPRGLLVRVGKEGHEAALKRPFTRPMEQGGRTAAGYIFVSAEGTASERDLRAWLDAAMAHVDTLPPKQKSDAKGASEKGRRKK